MQGKNTQEEETCGGQNMSPHQEMGTRKPTKTASKRQVPRPCTVAEQADNSQTAYMIVDSFGLQVSGHALTWWPHCPLVTRWCCARRVAPRRPPFEFCSLSTLVLSAEGFPLRPSVSCPPSSTVGDRVCWIFWQSVPQFGRPNRPLYEGFCPPEEPIVTTQSRTPFSSKSATTNPSK